MSSFVSASYILPLPWKIPVPSTCSPPPHPLGLWARPSKQGCSVQGCALSEDLISGFVTSEGAGGDSEEGKQRELLRDRGGWIDGWWLDSQRDDGRWIKGEIERDCRQRCCCWAPHISLWVTLTSVWTKYTAISQHRQAHHTLWNTGPRKVKPANIPCSQSS